MISMGAACGRVVSSAAARWARDTPRAALRKVARDEKEERDLITAGAGAGVAAAFGAPTGGLLFALEEVASSWSQTLTWQIFFCAMVSSTVTAIFLSSFAGFTFTPPFGYLYTLSAGQEAIEFDVSEQV